jgi:hypothetical protein
MIATPIPQYVMFGLFIAINVLAYLGVRGLRRLTRPTSEENLYRECGAARWGKSMWVGLYASWPFAKLSASRERLNITVGILGTEFSFERSQVLALRIRRILWGRAVEVENTKAGVPPFVLFHPSRIDRFRREMERLGYTVSDG